MSMLEILKEELKNKREYLIYMGEKRENNGYDLLFDRVSKDELLEYATDYEKGALALSKRRYF